MDLRVVGGRFRGRRLASPRGRGTRPSSARVRNAVMNILGSERLAGASVLDLYAGTGASGIEALSRGARRCLFVESARPALDALRRNLGTLGIGPGEARILAADAVRTLSRGAGLAGEPFDLVLCDPPYAVFGDAVAEGALREALGDLVRRGGLAEGAVLVVEHPAGKGFRAAPGGLAVTDTRAYSAAGVSLLTPLAGPPEGPPGDP